VEVPITFDLADAMYRSWTKQSFAVKDKLICEDMKRPWVNVAYRHQTFSGVGRETLGSMLKVEFNDGLVELFLPVVPDPLVHPASALAHAHVGGGQHHQPIQDPCEHCKCPGAHPLQQD